MKIGIILRCHKMKTLFVVWVHDDRCMSLVMLHESTCWGVGWMSAFDLSVFHTIYYNSSIYFLHKIFVPSEIWTHFYIYTPYFLHF